MTDPDRPDPPRPRAPQLPGTFAVPRSTDGPPAAAGGLGELQHEVLSSRLEQALADIAETAARVRERHARDTDPAPVAAMRETCAAPEAPLALRSLAGRVAAGHLSWQQVWDSPADHDGGMLLLARLVHRSSEATLDGLRGDDRLPGGHAGPRSREEPANRPRPPARRPRR